MNRTESRRILVIDDTPSIHDDFRKILAGEKTREEVVDQMAVHLFDDTSPQEGQKCNFEVDSAYQGQEGLEMIRRAAEQQRPYVMAFVDIRMPPGWDGLKTIERIRQEFPNLQIVICTAYSDYSWGELADRLGRSDRLFIVSTMGIKPSPSGETFRFFYLRGRLALSKAVGPPLLGVKTFHWSGP